MFNQQNDDFMNFFDDNQITFQMPTDSLFSEKEMNFSLTDHDSDFSFENSSFFDHHPFDISSPDERLPTDESFFDPQEFRDFKLPSSTEQSNVPAKKSETPSPIQTQTTLNQSIIPDQKNENLLAGQLLLLNLLNKEVKNGDHNKSLTSKSFIEQLIIGIQDHLNQQKLQSAAKNVTPSRRPHSKSVKRLDDEQFNEVCHDESQVLNPKHLGFIPSKIWEDKEITFGELVRNFFWKKNNSNCRFYHKLFNALKISEYDPFYIEFTGVQWVNDRILRVNKLIFARFLGIKSIDGSLFHQQGNFPSHGFIEITSKDALMLLPEQQLQGIDFETVRLLIHSSAIFVRSCTESDIEKCKWISFRKK